MDLKAELAVLSACDTARGRVGDGEGMIGVTWALFVAGVPTTIASQWQVPSESTTKLMLDFHKNLVRSGSDKIAEAWRQAALEMIKDPRQNEAILLVLDSHLVSTKQIVELSQSSSR